MVVAAIGSDEIVPWAHLNKDTLQLTVGPFNSTKPQEFECVVLAFKRINYIPIGNPPRGKVMINFVCKFSNYSARYTRLITLSACIIILHYTIMKL